MKIYCSRTEPQFEDFLDRDIWVKCGLSYRSDTYYLRIINILRDANKMSYFLIPSGYLDNQRIIDEYVLHGYNKLLERIDTDQLNPDTDIYTGKISAWSIIKPLDTYTTAEIKDIMNNIELRED